MSAAPERLAWCDRSACDCPPPPPLTWFGPAPTLAHPLAASGDISTGYDSGDGLYHPELSNTLPVWLLPAPCAARHNRAGRLAWQPACLHWLCLLLLLHPGDRRRAAWAPRLSHPPAHAPPATHPAAWQPAACQGSPPRRAAPHAAVRKLLRHRHGRLGGPRQLAGAAHPVRYRLLHRRRQPAGRLPDGLPALREQHRGAVLHAHAHKCARGARARALPACAHA